MRLSDQDADLFMDLVFCLQMYAGQRLGLISNINTLDEYRATNIDQKLEILSALYENLHLIDPYVQENPDNLPADNLAIIAQWKQCIDGEFFIERLLKKHTIFVGTDDKVYGVLGVHDSFQEIFHPNDLPVYVKTVLLPFKGKIVYDGFLRPYAVYFGRGVSSELKEDYLAAKQNGKIIESLEPGVTSDRPTSRGKEVKDWTPEIDALLASAQQIRSGAGQPPVHAPTINLVKASLELAQQAGHHPDDLDSLWKSLRKVQRTVDRVGATLHRGERYR